MSYRKGNGIWVVCDRFNVNRDDFEGTPDRVKANIDLVVEKARKLGMVSEGCFDISIRSEYGYEEVELEFVFERTETDRERAAREKAEAEEKAAAAAKRKSAAEKRKLKADAEYAEFLRLKEKFKGVA